MTELSRETEELLARGREGTPMPEARRGRLKKAVLAQIGAASLVALAWHPSGVVVCS